MFLPLPTSNCPRPRPTGGIWGSPVFSQKNSPKATIADKENEKPAKIATGLLEKIAIVFSSLISSTLVGAGIGFMLAGPIGACLGGIAGSISATALWIIHLSISSIRPDNLPT